MQSLSRVFETSRIAAFATLIFVGAIAASGCGQQLVHYGQSACSDAQKNGAETDVDCGGGMCGGCDDGKACVAGGDCKSGLCINNVCGHYPASCSNTIVDGVETDVDCGGTLCGACDDGKKCLQARDCKSSVCGGSGLCLPAACTDMVKNAVETDVDCGGGTCSKCDVAKGCRVGSDCTSGVCLNSACAATACTDGVRNGSETDVDCGGGACPGCSDGKVCVIGADCLSSVCMNGVCQAPACTDMIKNGNETDVDCGGGVCPKCPDLRNCHGANDCINSLCVNGQCQPASCADQIKNGQETDVDCGGQCPPCGPAKGCAMNGDCWNGVCVNGTCSGDATVAVGGMGNPNFDPMGDGSKLVVVDPDGNVTVDRQNALLNIARFIYVSNSGEGTVSKIDPNTQKEVARYCTAPGCNSDPSRASVSLDGNVGIANRANYFYNGVVHPERASAMSIAGDIERCVDRNGNGKIDTYLGAGPVPAQFQWPSNTSISPDECVLWWTPLIRDRNTNYVGGPGTLPRSATFDSKSAPDGSLSSNLYVGLYGTSELVQLDAKTGAIKQQIAVGGQPYSSVFDRFGYLWIRDAAAGRLIRVDTNDPALPSTFVGPAMPCNYAISADRRGYVYASGNSCVARLDPSQATPTWETLALPNACFTRGPSLDADFNLWVPDTCYGAFHVDASKPFGMGMTLKKAIPLPNPIPADPNTGYYLGSAIDGNAYPWIIGTQTDNLTASGGPLGKVFRIDPANGYTTIPVTVGTTPYVYSDLSGSQLALTAPTTGSYRKTFQAWCGSKATWTQLTWTDMVPMGTTVQVRYRAAKDVASLQTATFIAVGTEPPAITQPVMLAVPMGTDPSYLQVEFVIATSDTQNKPTLGNVSISYSCPQ